MIPQALLFSSFVASAQFILSGSLPERLDGDLLCSLLQRFVGKAGRGPRWFGVAGLAGLGVGQLVRLVDWAVL